MAMVINSRKRMRSESDEQHFTIQSKHFISEQTVNSHDTNKMKQIHEKTIKMLFQNANPKVNNNNNSADIASYQVAEQQSAPKWERFREEICLMGNGEVSYIAGNDAKAPTEGVTRSCFCAKTSSIQATDCINCNLEICEFCGISCFQCNSPLCMSCVQLFGCCDNSVDMNACCERCKQIYNI